MAHLVNLTPHAITIRGESADIVLAPEPVSARVAATNRKVYALETPFYESAEGIPVYALEFGEITGLPKPARRCSLCHEITLRHERICGCLHCEGGHGTQLVANEDEHMEPVVYITSMLVAQAAKRPDVLSPDSGSAAIRENGQVVAVLGLISWTSAPQAGKGVAE
jgi:hypothetical protein